MLLGVCQHWILSVSLSRTKNILSFNWSLKNICLSIILLHHFMVDIWKGRGIYSLLLVKLWCLLNYIDLLDVSDTLSTRIWIICWTLWLILHLVSLLLHNHDLLCFIMAQHGRLASKSIVPTWVRIIDSLHHITSGSHHKLLIHCYGATTCMNFFPLVNAILICILGWRNLVALSSFHFQRRGPSLKLLSLAAIFQVLKEDLVLLDDV